jgi:hypothetical protein
MGVKPALIDPKTVICPVCRSGVSTPCWTSAYGGTHRARRIAAEQHAHERELAEKYRTPLMNRIWP